VKRFSAAALRKIKKKFFRIKMVSIKGFLCGFVLLLLLQESLVKYFYVSFYLSTFILFFASISLKY